MSFLCELSNGSYPKNPGMFRTGYYKELSPSVSKILLSHYFEVVLQIVVLILHFFSLTTKIAIKLS